MENLKKLALKIVDRLDKAYPEAHQELNFSSAFELLTATVMAAQCTDVKVNQVTKNLFKKYPHPSAYVAADISELREDLRGISFSWSKAERLQNCCKMLISNFDGQVPGSVEELIELPGVRRKTANIVLANAMGIPAIGVDTHTIRVPNRLGWVDTQNPDKIEKALSELLPETKWHRGNIVIQWHGRYTCKAKKPQCQDCVVLDLCPWEDKPSLN